MNDPAILPGTGLFCPDVTGFAIEKSLARGPIAPHPGNRRALPVVNAAIECQQAVVNAHHGWQPPLRERRQAKAIFSA
jgi:hypothetical protein